MLQYQLHTHGAAAALVAPRRPGLPVSGQFTNPWSRASCAPPALRLGLSAAETLPANALCLDQVAGTRSRRGAGMGLVLALGSSLLIWAGLASLVL